MELLRAKLNQNRWDGEVLVRQELHPIVVEQQISGCVAEEEQREREPEDENTGTENEKKNKEGPTGASCGEVKYTREVLGRTQMS